MSSWLNWKTAICSILIGIISSAALFMWVGRSFTLSGKDLFFALAAVISFGFNLWQLFRDRYKYAPLKNSLIGLFNDLKSRQLRAHKRLLLIYSEPSMTASVEAVRLDFHDFIEE